MAARRSTTTTFLAGLDSGSLESGSAVELGTAALERTAPARYGPADAPAPASCRSPLVV